jgi:uncharacterized protein YbbC (DUF1343 family)
MRSLQRPGLPVYSLYGQTFRPSHPDIGTQHYDRLIGAAWIRRQIEADIEAGLPVAAILAQFATEWADDCRAFECERRPFLLYD